MQERKKSYFRFFIEFFSFQFFEFFGKNLVSFHNRKLPQDYSPNSGLSNDAIKIKIRVLEQYSISAQSYPCCSYGNSFAPKESRMQSEVCACSIRVSFPFLVEILSNLHVYSYSTFIPCVTSYLVVCLHRESNSADINSVQHTQVDN